MREQEQACDYCDGYSSVVQRELDRSVTLNAELLSKRIFSKLQRKLRLQALRDEYLSHRSVSRLHHSIALGLHRVTPDYSVLPSSYDSQTLLLIPFRNDYVLYAQELLARAKKKALPVTLLYGDRSEGSMRPPRKVHVRRLEAWGFVAYDSEKMLHRSYSWSKVIHVRLHEDVNPQAILFPAKTYRLERDYRRAYLSGKNCELTHQRYHGRRSEVAPFAQEMLPVAEYRTRGEAQEALENLLHSLKGY